MHGALKSVAVRLHFLCQVLGYDLSSGDRLIMLNIAPWESSPTNIITDWLPTAKSQAPGHCRIFCYEQADLLAKSAVELEEMWEVPRELQSCLSFGKKSINLL
ncbi:hypothetical protein Pmani_001042 [Petrolisthes manimaculis]|uniref:Uncharacterized protein n=1 Tax=Petrolisthes manimaculis TaxID=1843537 RepID=A0AAE1UPS3_9EUCA|nr:hypothetical protein Pmani_001042 [Petrolisthes manimaculis]